MALPKWRAAAFFVAFLCILSGCSGTSVPTVPAMRLAAVNYGTMPGWADSDPRAGIEALRMTCRQLEQSPWVAVPQSRLAAPHPGRWQRLCDDLAQVVFDAPALARNYVERWFVPYRLETQETGVLTGYHGTIPESCIQSHYGCKLGYIGAYGVPLTAGHSLAVDAEIVPLGAPVWISSTFPLTGSPMQRLVVAQDMDPSIIGPVQGGLFWGMGEAAEWAARSLKAPLEMWILLPAPDMANSGL